MKKSLFILVIAGLVGITSCKNGVTFFGKAKQAETKILTLEKENTQLKEKLAACEEQQNSEIMNIRADYEKKLADLQKKIESGQAAEYSGYFVVVGSFKNKQFAKEYASKIKQMGYEGKIVSGPNNFQLVTMGTYSSLKSAIEPMRKARQVIASESWIYFK